ncbi:extracellular solute-binding protein [Aureimonas fodinaquatilis]|uniref:Extracellular solute-binding protein n=1 Tax=Aureimonas fodinaquatilis TaxID=2565783 RepID=A0A5B0DT02_9HYPH|nr:extracellular solute-binding protein [Aureimonas fodinaquatilis]KAA0969528.1 extracellular solute-binding protein [Aureimonas fodinaquatilis]
MMSRKTSRREFLLQASAMAALSGIAGTGLFSTGAFAQAGPVRVTHFGGPYQILDQAVGAPFEAAGLGRVEYTASLTPATIGQLQASRANPPFDVVMLSRPAAVRAGRAGLLETIDTSKLPNLANLEQSSLSPEGFGIPFVLDTIEIMYNTKMVSSPITSWLDLWRPELQGKIALPSTSVVFAPDFVALVARSLGGDEKDPAAIDAAFEKIIELKSHVRTFTTNPEQASALMERGEIAACPQFGVRISSVIRNNPDVARAAPSEGVAARPYDLAIPAESPNKDLAYEYINFIIGRQAQENLATGLWATTVNRDVVVPDDLKDKIMTDFSKLIFWDDTYMASVERDWRTRWERNVQSG